MKAEGEIKFEGKRRIHFRGVRYDVAIQSVNEDVSNTSWALGLAQCRVTANKAMKAVLLLRSRSLRRT